MEKNSLKKNRAEKAMAEEAVFNRILRWIAGGAVLECLLLLLNRYWVYYTTDELDLHLALSVALKIVGAASVVCAVAAAFWWRGVRRIPQKAVLPAVLCPVFLGLSAVCAIAWFFPITGLRFLYIAVPAVIVLALIYHLYQHEFFLTALQSALVLLGIWIASKGTGGRRSVFVYGYAAVVVLLICGSIGLCWKLRKNEGAWSFRGAKVRVFSKDANYPILYVGAALLILVQFLAIMGISSVLLYSVTVAWALIMAVYYTVKLM